MKATIRRVDYYYVMVRDRPGEAYRLLSLIASGGVDLLAFNAIPMGGDLTQLVIFPENKQELLDVGHQAGLELVGPHPAFLIQGDDQLAALVDIHGQLFEAQINVSASAGVTDSHGSYGYIIYVAPHDFERATRILEC